MRSTVFIAPIVVLAGCASAGRTSFSTAGMGNVPNAVECAAEAIEEEGFTVTHRDDAGIVHARQGDHWIEASIVADGSERYVLNVRTADTDEARDAGEDMISECGGT